MPHRSPGVHGAGRAVTSGRGQHVTRWAETAVAAGSSAPEPDEGEDELLVALLRAARGIAGAERVADALPRIAEGAVAVVPDVRDAGVAVVDRGGVLAGGGHTTETA